MEGGASDIMGSSQDNASISLLDLSMKIVTLCVLTRSCHSVELANMDYGSIRYSPKGAHISLVTSPKQTKGGSVMKEYFFPHFEDVSLSSRGNTKGKHLFLTSTRPYHPATSTTTARWIKTILARAGVDTSIFCANSTRSASTSAAADAGVSVPEIQEAAD